MGKQGWPFANVDPFPAAGVDPIMHAEHVKDLYLHTAPDYDGRFTVPVLWDKKLGTIVNNESSEIIRIFNSAFNELIPEDKAKLDIYPENLRPEIDELNAWVYDNINSCVSSFLLVFCLVALTLLFFAFFFLPWHRWRIQGRLCVQTRRIRNGRQGRL